MSDQNTMVTDDLRRAVYIRLDNQNTQARDTVEYMKNHWLKYCKDNRWQEPDFYIDCCPARGDKKNLALLIRACMEGRYDIVMTSSASRFHRERSETMKILNRFKSCGVSVWLKNEDVVIHP